MTPEAGPGLISEEAEFVAGDNPVSRDDGGGDDNDNDSVFRILSVLTVRAAQSRDKQMMGVKLTTDTSSCEQEIVSHHYYTYLSCLV